MMSFPEYIYSFLWTQSNPDNNTSLQSTATVKANIEELKLQIEKLITKHATYKEQYPEDNKIHIRAKNKIAMLNHCLGYLNNPITTSDILNEQSAQQKLPANEQYLYNDSYWSVAGLGLFWQNLPSETATIVEAVLGYAKNFVSNPRFSLSADSLFDNESPNEQGFSPSASPRNGRR